MLGEIHMSFDISHSITLQLLLETIQKQHQTHRISKSWTSCLTRISLAPTKPLLFPQFTGFQDSSSHPASTSLDLAAQKSKTFPTYPRGTYPQTPNQELEMLRNAISFWVFRDAYGMLQGYVGVFLEKIRHTCDLKWSRRPQAMPNMTALRSKTQSAQGLAKCKRSNCRVSGHDSTPSQTMHDFFGRII